MKYSYTPTGVCASRIEFELDNGIVKNLTFTRGCDGNAKGIGRLAEGLPATTLIEKLSGIDCGGRGTSCPDQLTRALRAALDRG
ncbi:MAG: TIGR03905 family TSCPD domain-containing protein [Clostridiales Family XIII bacterium]|jgi:uncharacterized protein (TIGR03905 family)|nr:TIGR03905 family TSCPD domain-containing protein [Clostridiales Family XIII bacterium]